MADKTRRQPLWRWPLVFCAMQVTLAYAAGSNEFLDMSLEELVEDPHHWHNGFFREVDHPSEGRLRMMGSATRWNHRPMPALSPAPRLGQHSREILRSLGFGDAQLDAWHRDGVWVGD